MYAYLDAPLVTLERGEYFLIRSMRQWVRALGERRQCPAGLLEPAFERWGMAGALPHFHMAMIVLNRDGLRPLIFALPDCRTLADDEALMLEMFHGLREDAQDRVRETLALITSKGAVETLLLAFSAVAEHLRQADLPFGGAPRSPQERQGER